MSERLLTLTQVQDQTGFRKSKLYELIAAKEFPNQSTLAGPSVGLNQKFNSGSDNQIKTHRSS